jgi:hypothetical protein
MINDVIILISAISAVSAAGGLVFNGLAHLKESKIKYYQILRELQIDFDQIEEKYPGKNKIDLETDEVKDYKRLYCGFLEKLAHMANQNIIPKEIAEYYETGFRIGLMYLEKLSFRETIEKELGNMMSWCTKKNIAPYPRHENNKSGTSGGFYQEKKGSWDTKPFGNAVWVPKE